jgi:lipoprotein NlpI
VAVLRELGIRADPALIALGNNRRVGLQLPSAGQFDHVIVRLELDGQAYFVDPTLHKQTGKLDRIGQPHEGALVLVVDGAAAALTEIVSPRPDVLYAHTVDEVLTVADLDKAGTLEVTTTYRGLLAERARFQFGRVKVDDMRQSLIQRIARRYRDAKWLADPRIEDDPLENRLAVTERFEVPRPADASSEGWRIPYSPAIIAAATTAPTPQDRRSPLILYGFPADVRYSFEARFPAHVNGFLEPSGVAVRNKYFEFEGSSRFRGNVARDERRIRVIADAVPAADIHTYEKDLRKVLDLPASVIVSKRMVTTKEQLAQAPEASIEQRMRSEMEEVVKRVSASIEEGKLAGRDLAAAYAERASARGTLRRLDDALADANQAVKLAPRSAEAVAARAAIFYQRNETARAVTDYDRALALGPRDAAMLYADRGRALFFAGKFDNAALDFAQAVKVAEDHEQAAFHRLWLLIALQRGGQPLDPALRAAIENKADGDWPRPLAALLLGNRKPVDVLRIAQGKSGDERLMALCEAHFYIGQHYLIQGDPVRAQEHFERAIATRVILYVEYVAAAHELKRLRGKK